MRVLLQELLPASQAVCCTGLMDTTEFRDMGRFMVQSRNHLTHFMAVMYLQLNRCHSSINILVPAAASKPYAVLLHPAQ